MSRPTYIVYRNYGPTLGPFPTKKAASEAFRAEDVGAMKTLSGGDQDRYACVAYKLPSGKFRPVYTDYYNKIIWREPVEV